MCKYTRSYHPLAFRNLSGFISVPDCLIRECLIKETLPTSSWGVSGIYSVLLLPVKPVSGWFVLVSG